MSSSPPPAGNGSSTGIVAWFLLVVSASAILTRLATKWAIRLTFNMDDAFAVAALLSNIGSAAAVHVQATHGLAEPINTLSASQINIFLKSSYAAYLTYIPTLCFAKLSIIALLRLITPKKSHRTLAMALGISIAIWGGLTEIAVAFQCRVPKTWNTLDNRCFNRLIFWRFMGAFNIASDLALIILPLYIVLPVRMKSKKKLIVVGSFLARSLDVAATAVLLAFTGAFRSSDPTLDIWKWSLVAQLTQCITIVTSSVPYFRPLLDNLPTGMFTSDELRRRGLDASSYNSIENLSRHSGVPSSSWKPRMKTKRSSKEGPLELSNLNQLDPSSAGREISTVVWSDAADDGRTTFDAESQNSQSLIMQSITISQGNA